MKQNMVALAKANRIRLDRSELKKAVHAGYTWVEEVLRNPPECAYSMSVVELLSAQKGWGTTRSVRMIGRSEALEHNPYKKIGSMTHRERTKLADFLEGYVSQWS